MIIRSNRSWLWRWLFLGLGRLLRLTLCFLSGTLCLLSCTLCLLGLTAFIDFTLRGHEQTRIMFRMLQEILRSNPIPRQLRIAGQRLIFINNLLRRAAHFTFWPRTIKNPVHDISAMVLILIVVPVTVIFIA